MINCAPNQPTLYAPVPPGPAEVLYLGVHSAGVLEKGPPQRALVDAETLGNSRQIPHRLDGKLGDGQLARRVEAYLAVWHEPTASHAIFELGELHVRLGNGDGRSKVHCSALERRAWLQQVGTGRERAHAVFRLHGVLEKPRHLMAPGVHGHYLLLVAPLGEGPDVDGWLGIGEVGSMIGLELLAGHGQRIVDRVRATVRADSIPPPDGRGGTGHRDGTPLHGIRVAPLHRQRLDSDLLRIGGQDDAGCEC